MNFGRNSPYQNPFDKEQKPQLQKNYSDTFNPEEYECKDSIELESYARNLRNYLMTLLQQEPFPQFLFDKLEKRLDGIVSILAKRSAASNVSNKEQARARLKALDSALNKAVEITLDSPEPQDTLEDTRPTKKRRLLPEYVKDINKARQELKDSQEKFSFNTKGDEEEEESTQSTDLT